MNEKCKCWSIMHTTKSLFDKDISRKLINECTSGGGFLQYYECKCKLCNRIWDET